MIVILHPNTSKRDPEYLRLMDYLGRLPGITPRTHEEIGSEQTLTEIYLIGTTSSLDIKDLEAFEVVEHVVRVSQEYRVLGRHKGDTRASHFEYNGVRFGQDTLQVFAGLCAVDTPGHTEEMLAALRQHAQVCTRMGAYKPRTNPYSFQGHGKACLPYVFELSGKYGIKVVAMEIMHDAHIAEIDEALEQAGNPTGVMLQIGTRNTQNFELLKCAGRQKRYPVLIKRGFGITLEESLNAAEYLASEGNRHVVFCLRGIKTNMGDPHRNLVDFTHIPVVQRLTRMPVCIDPSHSVGGRGRAPDGVLDLLHASAQGVIAGANMILVDFHPRPSEALVDGPQALLLSELGAFLEDVAMTRAAYERRCRLHAPDPVAAHQE
ncbi:MAG: 3-deoxy-7-phosphoheptulonate synthase [Gammaproteobacteria bacterium]